MRLFSVVCVLLLLTGNARGDNNDTCGYQEEILKRLERVSLADGASEEEAVILAENYFAFFISGCGSASFPKDMGDRWSFEVRQGLAGILEGEVIIDKKDGAVLYEGHPSVGDPVRVLLGKQKELMASMGCSPR